MAEEDTPAVEDAVLLERWREGDGRAGSQLIDRHTRLLFRFFRTKAPAEADDLAQRCFTTCIERRDQIREGASFRGYLLAIARTVLIDHFRQRSAHERRFDALEVSVADLDPSPSQQVFRSETEHALHQALREIPLELQVALELYYWEGLRGPELAQALALPEGTVRTRLRRGRQLLKAHMPTALLPEGE